MSNILERLTEGVVNRDMRAESHALLNKWKKTGLLEGLEDERQQNTMSRLLENQAKELLRESTTLGAGSVEGFAAVAFPIVRRVFAGLIANDLVSVQPMSLPSGLIFFLDFTFSGDLGASGSQLDRLGNRVGKSIYGTNQVGSEIISGVDLIDDSNKAGFGGPLRDGATGYAYASPTGSTATTVANDTSNAVIRTFLLNGSVSAADAKRIQYDPDLLSITDSTYGVIVLDVATSEHDPQDGGPDFNNLSPFIITGLARGTERQGAAGHDFVDAIANHGGITSGSLDTVDADQIRRLTTRVSNADSMLDTDGGEAIRYVITGLAAFVSADSAAAAVGAVLPIGAFTMPLKDEIDNSSTVGAVVGDLFPLEKNESIPEIDIKVDSTAVTAQTKKLKAKWTPELGQDLNAYHNLDAEVELTSILSEQIALEIDREILADLVNGATAATYYWSRSPGLFVNRETGAEIGALSAAPDFTGTVSEWYETLVETINDVSAQIHRKTLRGGANFVVCGPEVANVLEFTAGFRASVTHDDEKGSIGALRVGSLSKKFDVIVDPYFPRQLVLVGRRGASFLESGYVYAPYVPLQTTPTIFGPEDFVPRKGVMTRYAKKMVRPDMYGLVIVRGLLGEAGATS
jgi:hypothetical protein